MTPDQPQGKKRKRRPYTLLGITLALLPVVCILSLYLLTAASVTSHGTPTPTGVLKNLWAQSIEGDEELFVLMAFALWSISWSYFLAGLFVIRKLNRRTLFPLVFVALSFLTSIGAALEGLWRPYCALGNCIVAALWLCAILALWVFHIRSTVKHEAEPEEQGVVSREKR
jgi:hypothetical protein